MTPAEIERFIKSQLNMGARIAQKANRARIGAAAFTNIKGGSGPSLGDRIIAAIDRPGVAPSSRPLSKEGAQTFHFALTTVSRTSEFAKKTKNNVSGKAGDHMSYIERDGAAETIDADIRREADAIDEEAWKILGGQDYIERPGAAEVLTDGRTVASFGNIAETLEERVAYWTALEAAAATPKTHGIIADRTRDEAFWKRVDEDPAAPSILRSTPHWIALPVNASTPDAERLNKSIPIPRVSDKVAIAVAQYAAKHRSRSRSEKPAVTIDPGRGGRIQNRIIVELPHELSPEQRLKLAQDVCHKHFVEGRTAPLPHWCVIHAPDHHNDPRNTHMHIVFAERPASRMKHPETGEECWDFSIQIKVRDNAKHIRLQRPFEQAPDRSLQDRSWVKKARQSYADLANAALIAAGRSKIYDARSYKNMGIEVKPNKHINRKDYTSEKKGISTKAGEEIIALQWSNEQTRLEARHPSLYPDRKVLEAFANEIKRWSRSTTSTKYKLMDTRNEWIIAQAHRKYYAAEAAANAFVMRKIKSKLAPPLGSDAKTTEDVTNYLKMFKADLIDKHGKAAQQWQRNERYLLTRLRQAQMADPKTATMNTFLDGSAIMQAMNGMMTQARIKALSTPSQTLEQRLKTSIEMAQIAAEETRTVKAEITKVAAARRGHIEQYAPAARGKEDPAEAANIPSRQGRDEEALQVPDPQSLPTWGADNGGRFSLPPRSDERSASQAPAKSSTRSQRPSDEKSFMFMSDTGAPVQRRVISPSLIKRTEARAAAVIAAAKQRRIEREALFAAAQAAEERHARAKAFRERHANRSPPDPGTTAGNNDPRPTKRPEDGTPSTITPEAVPPVPATRVAPPVAAPAAPAGPARAAAPPEKTTAAPRPFETDKRTATPSPTGPASTTPTSTTAIRTPMDRAKPLLQDSATVYQPSQPAAPTPPLSPSGASATTTTPSTIRIEDIEVTDAPPKKKKRVLTAEQLRQRALLAAKNRGRGR